MMIDGRRRHASCLGVLILWTLLGVQTDPANASGPNGTPHFPPPAPIQDPASLGLHIQRTMTLLATSTPEHRNKVRILFYGQSITEQYWWKTVADDLRRRFPSADLEIESRAIGGFASLLLVRPAEHDLYPFYPHLLIFHVYGDYSKYEEIIRAVRSRTTAEVLMQTDHATVWPPVIDKSKDKGSWWGDQMNHSILPDIARRYGCVLADVRGGWLGYLKANHLEPASLLKDEVHLNDQGNFLMAELIKPYLIHRPDLPDSDWRDLTKLVEVGGTGGPAWKNGTLSLQFDGNRVDLVAAAPEKGQAASARVRIDGRTPSEFPELYRITRPEPRPWSPLAVTRVDHSAPLIAEDWTLTITEVNADASSWRFRVSGSKTGDDGEGSNRLPSWGSIDAWPPGSGRSLIRPYPDFASQTKKGTIETWMVGRSFPMVFRTAAIVDLDDRCATSPAQDQGDDEQDDEDEQEDSRDSREVAFEATEAEHTGDQGQDREDNSKTKHGWISFELEAWDAGPIEKWARFISK